MYNFILGRRHKSIVGVCRMTSVVAFNGYTATKTRRQRSPLCYVLEPSVARGDGENAATHVSNID